MIYTLAQVGLQGVVSPAKLQANSASALVYVAQALGGGFWAKMMALSIALSVIATTGTGIVLSSRIVYGMASYRTLPGFLSNVSRRYRTPVAASIAVGVLLIALTWVYLLATSVQNAFNDVIAVTGQLFAIFYIMTALATIVYYRRRVFAQRQGRADPGPAAARRRRVPRLDARAVGAGGVGGSGQVAGRHRRGRGGADAQRAVRAALPVLRHPAGERPGLKPGPQLPATAARASCTVRVTGSPGGRACSQRASASLSRATASVTRPTAW